MKIRLRMKLLSLKNLLSILIVHCCLIAPQNLMSAVSAPSIPEPVPVSQKSISEELPYETDIHNDLIKTDALLKEAISNLDFVQMEGKKVFDRHSHWLGDDEDCHVTVEQYPDDRILVSVTGTFLLGKTLRSAALSFSDFKHNNLDQSISEIHGFKSKQSYYPNVSKRYFITYYYKRGDEDVQKGVGLEFDKNGSLYELSISDAGKDPSSYVTPMCVIKD